MGRRPVGGSPAAAVRDRNVVVDDDDDAPPPPPPGGIQAYPTEVNEAAAVVQQSHKFLRFMVVYLAVSLPLYIVEDDDDTLIIPDSFEFCASRLGSPS